MFNKPTPIPHSCVWALALNFYTDLSPFHIVYLCSLPVWLPPSTLSPSLKPFKSMCSQRTFVQMYSNTAASFITPSPCVFSLHQTSPCDLYIFHWIQWSLNSYCLKDFLHQDWGVLKAVKTWAVFVKQKCDIVGRQKG